VTFVTSPFGILTEMAAPPPHPSGARPKTTVATPKIRYACVVCDFEDFKTAHSLRRHLIQFHTLSCDTIVQGCPFPHVGYMMRRLIEREKTSFHEQTFLVSGQSLSDRMLIQLKYPTDPHLTTALWEGIPTLAVCQLVMPMIQTICSV